MYDNVLDESQSDKVQFRNCKLKYLKAENKLLTLQLGTVCRLVDLHKKILNILASKDEVCTETIESLIETANSMIEECYQEYEQMINKKDLFPENQENSITPNFFMELVLSFEKTISELKLQIHHREALLQELESNKNLTKIRKFQPESKALTKAIQSYDIYPRLAEKCRQQILQLKMAKGETKMNQNTKCHPFKEISSQNTVESTLTSSEIDKTVKIQHKDIPSKKNVSRLRTQKKVDLAPCEQMTPFQKMILIYKKKKLFNEIMENRVISLRNKIHEKEMVNKILRGNIEREAWNIAGSKVHAFQDGQATFMSMLNQTLNANNLEFSVDISRVLLQNYREQQVNGNLILDELKEEGDRNGCCPDILENNQFEQAD